MAEPAYGARQIRQWRNALRTAAVDADWRQVDDVRHKLTGYLARDGEPRELHCEDCDQDYPVWAAPNELWNKVVREPANAAGVTEPFLCLTCFALRAERHGIVPTAWVVSPEARSDYPRIGEDDDAGPIVQVPERQWKALVRLYSVTSEYRDGLDGPSGEASPKAMREALAEVDPRPETAVPAAQLEARIAELEEAADEVVGGFLVDGADVSEAVFRLKRLLESSPTGGEDPR